MPILARLGFGPARFWPGPARSIATSSWETIQQIISDEDHDCFGKFSNTFASEGSPIFLSNLGSIFSRTIGFILKMTIFLIHGLSKCERVGEDSRHGNGHVDIQVGSRNYLSVCLNWSIAYALRWRVTHLG